ncbi:sensor histidine kinase [Clostridium pasteurianum]|uniref:histidine kinase n=1 Tax=Clostridium pasteurianum BC1 TaxID=86416 RepID=R4KB78_CLOPA|nr:ATP-binding protein [Clostridium pasteurianum]AGK98936.1 signal transduction histidine kinase [Clostridium pasteurianum BC1]
MKSSLKTKLALTYALVAIISILMISLMTNVFLEKQFKEYTIENQENKNKELADLISKQYSDNENWNYKSIESIGINALEQGLIIKLSDNSGKVIWDAATHNNGLCKQMIDHIENNMTKYYGNSSGKYEEKLYTVHNNNNKIGNLQIGYYGPFYYSDNDIEFINTLNKLLLGVGMLALFFAVLLGLFMAKMLSNPISRVVKAAQNIANGFYNNKITEKSETAEIDLLISTINNLAETLENQKNLRKRMSADIAHELRTPLATLQSHLEAMIDGIWKPSTERLESCHEESLRINRLIGDLENLAEYESENYKLSKVKYDIYDQIKKIIYNFQADFKNKGININLNGKREIVFADKDKISQVIINLISNSLKYTPKDGNVEIIIDKSDKEIIIKIKDTGRGISSEDLPYIFERFYRVDKSRNRLTGGAGIGLTIAKAIVNFHKGNIAVKSNLGKGTEFTVLLPKGI